MSKQNLATYPSLADKAVFITGGASGIGASIVEGFARQKSKVVFIDINEEDGKKLATETNTTFLTCDLTSVEQIKKTVDSAKSKIGDIQVLVNNAANDTRHAWEDVTEEYWDDRIAINLRHTFFVTQAVAPDMVKAKSGAIINFGSSSWMLAQGNMPAYTASKAGTHGMTRSFARDLGKNNIRVNTIVPGWVMTQRQKDMWLTPESKKDMEEKMCLAGEVMPEDIANMALWLAADDSKMCTAQNFIVDGGWV